MKSKTISVLTATALLTILFTACSAIARHHSALMGNEPAPPGSVAKDNSDPISGEWNVSFLVPGHEKTPATFTFKLDGQTVTGTAYSDHTGAGTIRDGRWADGKLSFVLDFKKHESISVKGGLQDGKLAGDFTTEGFTAKWEAVKK